jgi:hypothetical protein
MNKRITKNCKIHGDTTHRLDSRNKEKNKSAYRCVKCCSESVQRRRDKIKQLAVDYKGGKCTTCGYNKCIASLDFHHLDPNEKDFGISAKGLTRSFEKVKVELDKCILLCSNCHRELHFNQNSMTV